MSKDSLQSTKGEGDPYIHGMDWLSGELEDFELSNYRKYQYDLISSHIGGNILEIGSGDRSFTNQLLRNFKSIERIISIEPSATLFNLHENKYRFPPSVSFHMMDLFEMSHNSFGLFDTAILIHVLEHIEEDRAALNKVHELLLPKGKVLVEVPALPFLFSVHDEMLGHYRRYDKLSLKNIVDYDKYVIKDLWYQDPIGVFGSLYFFKLRRIKLASSDGVSLVKNEGKFYDQYIIPFENRIERFVRFPFGLSLTAILEKK